MDEVKKCVLYLSRKGFDSAVGVGPSSVLEDGTMLSLPIPEVPEKGYTYSDLKNWHRYD